VMELVENFESAASDLLKYSSERLLPVPLSVDAPKVSTRV
jgi:hypothetical protein